MCKKRLARLAQHKQYLVGQAFTYNWIAQPTIYKDDQVLNPNKIVMEPDLPH
jgi:hypothetical protein